ncbi:MAG: hypothetical protein WCF74_09485, partial [Candidatus Sulfotelmatobacter sp.]
TKVPRGARDDRSEVNGQGWFLTRMVFDKDGFVIREEFFYSVVSRLFFTQAAVVNSPPTVA